ncbi:hypothetical protein ZHAS_00005926 [Anopheles sinensis]|uniref:Uncharacterized protein n=1 Tax=Anopheles sinensis TaxID=74873 RepID=A0A084VKM4_ANOSI|nr:hypothetical protein ZHAS_00005926 [Anopheles sinensis]
MLIATYICSEKSHEHVLSLFLPIKSTLFRWKFLRELKSPTHRSIALPTSNAQLIRPPPPGPPSRALFKQWPILTNSNSQISQKYTTNNSTSVRRLSVLLSWERWRTVKFYNIDKLQTKSRQASVKRLLPDGPVVLGDQFRCVGIQRVAGWGTNRRITHRKNHSTPARSVLVERAGVSVDFSTAIVGCDVLISAGRTRKEAPVEGKDEPGDEGVERPATKDVLSSGSVSPSSSSTPPSPGPADHPPPATTPGVTHDGLEVLEQSNFRPVPRSSSASSSAASPTSSLSPSNSPPTKQRRTGKGKPRDGTPTTGRATPEVNERIPEPSTTPSQLIDSHDDVEHNIPATLIHDPTGHVHQQR